MGGRNPGTSLSYIFTLVADTDITPYDPGSYASSGTYVTGRAVVAACEDLKRQILDEAASRYQLERKTVDLGDGALLVLDGDTIELRDLAEQLSSGPPGDPLIGIAALVVRPAQRPIWPGFARINTTQLRPVRFWTMPASSTAASHNPNLALIQAEGGIGLGSVCAL
jgi:CO/xanthine dehydrogenase Mo-binding subunit